MRLRPGHIWILFMVFTLSLSAQEKVTLDGYLSDMQTVYHVPDNWLWENSLHNRLNLHFYPTDWLSGSVQVRNRVIIGNTIIINFRDMPNLLTGTRAGWIWPG